MAVLSGGVLSKGPRAPCTSVETLQGDTFPSGLIRTSVRPSPNLLPLSATDRLLRFLFGLHANTVLLCTVLVLGVRVKGRDL